jgi:hypothetical protein
MRKIINNILKRNFALILSSSLLDSGFGSGSELILDAGSTLVLTPNNSLGGSFSREISGDISSQIQSVGNCQLYSPLPNFFGDLYVKKDTLTTCGSNLLNCNNLKVGDGVEVAVFKRKDKIVHTNSNLIIQKKGTLDLSDPSNASVFEVGSAIKFYEDPDYPGRVILYIGGANGVQSSFLKAASFRSINLEETEISRLHLSRMMQLNFLQNLVNTFYSLPEYTASTEFTFPLLSYQNPVMICGAPASALEGLQWTGTKITNDNMGYKTYSLKGKILPLSLLGQTIQLEDQAVTSLDPGYTLLHTVISVGWNTTSSIQVRNGATLSGNFSGFTGNLEILQGETQMGSCLLSLNLCTIGAGSYAASLVRNGFEISPYDLNIQKKGVLDLSNSTDTSGMVVGNTIRFYDDATNPGKVQLYVGGVGTQSSYLQANGAVVTNSGGTDSNTLDFSKTFVLTFESTLDDTLFTTTDPNESPACYDENDVLRFPLLIYPSTQVWATSNPTGIPSKTSPEWIINTVTSTSDQPASGQTTYYAEAQMTPEVLQQADVSTNILRNIEFVPALADFTNASKIPEAKTFQVLRAWKPKFHATLSKTLTFDFATHKKSIAIFPTFTWTIGTTTPGNAKVLELIGDQTSSSAYLSGTVAFGDSSNALCLLSNYGGQTGQVDLLASGFSIGGSVKGRIQIGDDTVSPQVVVSYALNLQDPRFYSQTQTISVSEGSSLLLK